MRGGRLEGCLGLLMLPFNYVTTLCFLTSDSCATLEDLYHGKASGKTGIVVLIHKAFPGMGANLNVM